MATNNSFLWRVAQDIFRRYQNQELDLTKTVMVFPNKRASFFFNQELSKVSDRPLWMPQCKTITDLFLSLSPYTPIDSIPCICELHKCYQKALNSSESINDFYGWGEVLLSDFDDIDKQMVHAENLFQSIESWHQLTATADFLTNEQITAIRKYFSSFSPERNDEIKLRFVHLWEGIPEIYQSLNNNLKMQNLLYDGALYRDVVENRLEQIDMEKTYAFVGFNVLTKVQEKLLQEIHYKGNALFYWDYDDRLNEKSEGISRLIYDAGSFIRSYEATMPNALQFDKAIENQKVAINFIRTDSSNAQAHYVPLWIAENACKDSLSQTVIVLADESMLPQVLNTLPDENVNITMGYKLSDTPVISFINSLIDLQLNGKKSTELPPEEGQINVHFYNSFFEKVKKHPFTQFLNGKNDERMHVWNRIVADDAAQMLDYLDTHVLTVLKEIPNYSDEIHSPLYAEALYRAHVVIGKLQKMNLGWGRDLTCSLLLQMLRSLSVPFQGEETEGIQVMGMLETRSIYFENVLILSANDGILPRQGHITSLIPYCLREYVGLTTEKQHINIYAYNFFRLLQQARKATLMFPASDTDSGQCEMSRFMRRLLAETDLEIPTQHLDFSSSEQKEIPMAQIDDIEKSEETVRAMAAQGNGQVFQIQRDEKTEWRINNLSPSAINTYLNCPLSYYFKYIAKITVEQKITTSLADNQFGTVFHKTAENFYTTLMQAAGSNRITLEMLEQSRLSDAQIDEAIDEAFRSEIFEQKYSEVKDYAGSLVIARKVMREYLLRLIRMDKRMAPFRILQMEKRHYSKVRVRVCNTEQDLYIGGIIDRLDYIEKHPQTGMPAIRVVDYKTGSRQKNDSQIRLVSDLFDSGNCYIFQTFLYAQAIQEELSGMGKVDSHIEAQNGGPIQLTDREKAANVMPSIIFIREATEETYDARLRTGDTPIDNFALLADGFRKNLTDFLSKRMLNPAEKFTRTKNEKHCSYCDYRLLCGKCP